MAPRPSHRPPRDRGSLHHPEMAQAGARLHQDQEGPLGHRDLVLSPCGFSVQREDSNTLGSCLEANFLQQQCRGNECTRLPVTVDSFHSNGTAPRHVSCKVHVKMCACRAVLAKRRSRGLYSLLLQNLHPEQLYLLALSGSQFPPFHTFKYSYAVTRHF